VNDSNSIPPLDLIIRNARLRDGALRDIGVLDGRIHLIDETLPHPAALEVDDGGD
jgi:hypothetical protein